MNSGQKWLNELIPFELRVPLIGFLRPSSEAVRQLQRLHQDANKTFEFIQKTSIYKNNTRIRLNSLPWYFMIGPKQSGKTELLGKSGINYVRKYRAAQSDNTQNNACGWWITPGALLIDVPGRLLHLNKTQPGVNEEVWQYLLQYVQRKHQSARIGGVIVAIAANQLLSRNGRDVWIYDLQARIVDLQKHFGRQVPIYFVITKADTMPGFQEFFDDFDTEELMQAWGVTMPAVKSSDTNAIAFVKRFNALIRQLNRQMLRQLHHERNLHAKSHIKNFPLYVERIKEEFASLLNKLDIAKIHISLRGVYLASATQNENAERFVSGYDTLSSADFMRVKSSDRSCFIKQLLLQGIMA